MVLPKGPAHWTVHWCSSLSRHVHALIRSWHPSKNLSVTIVLRIHIGHTQTLEQMELRTAVLFTMLLLVVALNLACWLAQPTSMYSIAQASADGDNMQPHARPDQSLDAMVYVGVLSGSTNTQKRMAIRRSWGSDPRLQRVVFVVANPIGNSSLLEVIRKEALQYQDLILLSYIEEHYFNLAYQTLEIFRSAYAFGRPITHVMKCDDDSYVHVSRLLELLAVHPWERTLVGHLTPYFVAIRQPGHKWYLSKEEWPADRTDVPYPNGPGYLVTKDLANELAAGAAVKCMPGKFLKFEDVAMGLWIDCLRKQRNLYVNAVSDGRFNADVLNSCTDQDIVSHYRTPQQMLCMFDRGGTCC